MISFDLQTPLQELQDFLSLKNWLKPQEKVEEISKPGEGNMNVVLRVKTNLRSLILKQSRPFVQKYKQIKAPLERIEVENHFYKAIAPTKVSHHFPEIYYHDSDNYIMVLEDLGDCKDMSSIYNSGSFTKQMLETLVEILNSIHSQKNLKDYPPNTELRTLNHQHVFVLPFMKDNGFALDTVQDGLQNLSLEYKTDKELKNAIDKIGEVYLAKGDVLLHGDFYPGSWMQIKDKIYVIDPEFSFLGFKEFDLGIMLAHAIMANMDDKVVGFILGKYQWEADLFLVKQVAGIEIMRRIIGLAQLPLQRSLKEKDYLLRMARKMILP